MRAPLVFTFAVASCASACIAYNDPCAALVDNPTERMAFVQKGTEIWLDKPNARHANHAIGQAAADAFTWVFADSDAPADFAVENGGGIRADGLCTTRNILKEGPLTNGVLHEVLLFENVVQAVDLSEQEVHDMFEHSAEKLFPTGTAIVNPAGSFLHVSSGVTMEIDCSKPALSRVVSLKIGNQTVQNPGRPFPQVKYRAAMVSFIASGGDGYTMLAGKADDQTRNPKQAQRFGGIDSNITAAYLKQSAFNQTIEAGMKVEPRIKFTNCAVPTRPTSN